MTDRPRPGTARLVTDDEAERRDFMEGVRELLARPGITLDEVRHAIATQAPTVLYLTLADADRMLQSVRKDLAADYEYDAAETISTFCHRVVSAMATTHNPAQMIWFRALAKKVAEADKALEEHRTSED